MGWGSFFAAKCRADIRSLNAKRALAAMDGFRKRGVENSAVKIHKGRTKEGENSKQSGSNADLRTKTAFVNFRLHNSRSRLRQRICVTARLKLEAEQLCCKITATVKVNAGSIVCRTLF